MVDTPIDNVAVAIEILVDVGLYFCGNIVDGDNWDLDFQSIAPTNNPIIVRQTADIS